MVEEILNKILDLPEPEIYLRRCIDKDDATNLDDMKSAAVCAICPIDAKSMIEILFKGLNPIITKQIRLVKRSGIMKEPQPNYFLAFQIINAQIRINASILQNHIIEKDPTIAKALIKQGSFHLTLKVLHLRNSSEVELARNAFVKAVEKYQQEFTNEQLYLDFQDIREFFEEILYAKLDSENIVKASLNPVLEEIAKEITKSGVQLANQESWKSHLTLVDIRKVNRLRKEARKLQPSLSSNFKNMGFGWELVQ
ncbi:A-kinase anchor protein 7-like, partial [Artemia franciscana]|uniref:A-kinase anchor protein 7-like n=1 Tax=Artemia franciscana TaxID=6661 RepID=UPI0032DA2ABA